MALRPSKSVEQLGNLRARQASAITHPGRARDEIAAALHMLEQAAALHSTIERESLCGSAWKRLAMLEAAARRPKDEAKAVQKMKIHYGRAEALARAENDPQLFYPALNRMAAELVVDAGKPRWRKFDSAAVDDARASLVAKARDDPDFWSVVGLTELRIYLAIADRKLAGELDVILGELDDLYARVSAPSEWSSVLRSAALRAAQIRGARESGRKEGSCDFDDALGRIRRLFAGSVFASGLGSAAVPTLDDCGPSGAFFHGDPILQRGVGFGSICTTLHARCASACRAREGSAATIARGLRNLAAGAAVTLFRWRSRARLAGTRFVDEVIAAALRAVDPRNFAAGAAVTRRRRGATLARAILVGEEAPATLIARRRKHLAPGTAITGRRLRRGGAHLSLTRPRS